MKNKDVLNALGPQLTELLDAAFEGAYVVTPERKIVYWNKAAAAVSGYDASETLGSYCQHNLLRHEDDSRKQLCLGKCPLVEAMEQKNQVEKKVYMHQKYGGRIPVHVRVIPITKDDVVIGAVELFCEAEAVNELRVELNKLRTMAFIDELTETLNRRGLEFVLEDRVQEACRYNRRFLLLFLDLDDFKSVNDRFGHLVGDELLKTVASMLLHSLRATDKVARLGGDEFVVIAEVNGERSAEFLSQRILQLISRTFIEVSGEKVGITASVGATVVDGTKKTDELLKLVDRLMYESKARGKNTYTLA